MTAAARHDEGPVGRYLDEMFDLLSGTGAAGRRLLAEAEEHLVDTVAGLLALLVGVVVLRSVRRSATAPEGSVR